MSNFGTLNNRAPFVIVESFNQGFIDWNLDFIIIMSIIFGILVVISKNPVVSVLYLIGLFAFVSIYLSSIGITFIALAYLLVYVGAVSILFLFILMLINVRISELLYHTINSIGIAIVILILLHSTVYNIYPMFSSWLQYKTFFVGGPTWDGYLAVAKHITSIGNIMYTSLGIWFIIASIILLLAMVGAIAITIKSELLHTSFTNMKKKVILSACRHTPMLYCAICIGGNATRDIATCTHSWSLLFNNFSTSYVGFLCNFGDPNHVHLAVSSLHSVALTCQMCHAACCLGCCVF